MNDTVVCSYPVRLYRCSTVSGWLDDMYVPGNPFPLLFGVKYSSILQSQSIALPPYNVMLFLYMYVLFTGSLLWYHLPPEAQPNQTTPGLSSCHSQL